MNVYPIAWTATFPAQMKLAEPEWSSDAETGGEQLIEYAGRVCYASWSKPNPKTATIAGYLRNIRLQGHFSVYEHATATMYFTGVSRSLTHELIRHRHFSFSELSQRFVDVEHARFVAPPGLYPDGWPEEPDGVVEDLNDAMTGVRRVYHLIADFLLGKGLNRKQAREAARSVMPNMTETRIVVTGNLRAWRHFIKVRGTIHADAEIRAAAVKVAGHLFHLYEDAMDDVEFYIENGQRCVRLIEGE